MREREREGIGCERTKQQQSYWRKKNNAKETSDKTHVLFKSQVRRHTRSTRWNTADGRIKWSDVCISHSVQCRRRRRRRHRSGCHWC